jgi:hypothetical protein
LSTRSLASAEDLSGDRERGREREGVRVQIVRGRGVRVQAVPLPLKPTLERADTSLMLVLTLAMTALGWLSMMVLILAAAWQPRQG